MGVVVRNIVKRFLSPTAYIGWAKKVSLLICDKNYKNWLAVDKVNAKIIRPTLYNILSVCSILHRRLWFVQMSGFTVGQVGQKAIGCLCCWLVSTHRPSLSSYVQLQPFVHFACTNPQCLFAKYRRFISPSRGIIRTVKARERERSLLKPHFNINNYYISKDQCNVWQAARKGLRPASWPPGKKLRKKIMYTPIHTINFIYQ